MSYIRHIWQKDVSYNTSQWWKPDTFLVYATTQRKKALTENKTKENKLY